MPTSKKRVPVPGTERRLVPGAQVVGAPDPNQRIEVTVILRRRPSSEGFPPAEGLGARPVSERQHLTREEFAARYGALPDDVTKVEQFAAEHNLRVEEVSVARRSIKLSGTVADLNAAFGVTLEHYQHAGATFRSRTGSIFVPEDLQGIVTGVLGFTNRPVARPHYRLRNSGSGNILPRAQNVSYTPVQVAEFYNFPSGVDGTGQCIGIIELDSPADPSQPTTNVGAGFSTQDLDAFFSQLNIPKPTVTVVSVDNGQNLPGVNPDADGEVTLDIEIAGALAPAANIAVYFAPNTDQGFLDSVTTAIHDATNRPSVISISWGGPEGEPLQTMQTFDQALQDAAALGVTVCVASGDDGSSDGVNDNLAHVDFPSSSPHALACGGTRLEASGTTISSEVVWNDGSTGLGATGGGVSAYFPLPPWQANANVPPSHNPGNYVGRGVPDVSGDADPETGYQIVLGGKTVVVGGTSAVAPLWSGLIALINQHLGKPVGFLNPLLYGTTNVKSAFRDITQGNNDIDNLSVYRAGSGWDPCTGLGSPNGAALMQALSGAAAAAQGSSA